MLTTALIKGTNIEVFPDRSRKAEYTCIDCGEDVIQKHGYIRCGHFAHKNINIKCDTRHHDEKSPWHIASQMSIDNPQPGINVEVNVCKGECIKRADNIAPSGLVIEYQYSSLPLQERLLREKYYKNMIWVIHRKIHKSLTWRKYITNIPQFIDFEDGFIHLVNNKKRGIVYNSGYLCSMVYFKISKEKFLKLFVNNSYKNAIEIFNGIIDSQIKKNKYSGGVFNPILFELMDKRLLFEKQLKDIENQNKINRVKASCQKKRNELLNIEYKITTFFDVMNTNVALIEEKQWKEFLINQEKIKKDLEIKERMEREEKNRIEAKQRGAKINQKIRSHRKQSTEYLNNQLLGVDDDNITRTSRDIERKERSYWDIPRLLRNCFYCFNKLIVDFEDYGKTYAKTDYLKYFYK